MALKQHESATAVLFWQLNGLSEGQVCRAASAPVVVVSARRVWSILLNTRV